MPESTVQTVEPPNPPLDRASQRRARGRAVAGWLLFLAVVVVASALVRTYALQTFFVPSPSMTPTLVPGDRIIVNKLSSTVHRGDIVVFHDVPADTDGPPTLVKRVIGLPGETISSVGNTVYINGKPLPEPWLPKLKGPCRQTAALVPRTKIPANHYFMMGDCRGNSGDSRLFGTVPGSNFIGKVDLVIWRSGHPWLHWF